MSKKDWQENSFAVLFNIPPVVSILDVACGLALKSKYIPAQIRVGVDIYPEYFKHIESEVPYVVVKHDVRDLDSIFEPKSFDLVIACDIVEHLEKSEGLALIQACERIACVGVIIETPLGYIPQDMDILGYGGDKYQTHRSAWEVSDFPGYEVKVRPYTMTDKKRHSKLDVPRDIQLIEAFKCLSSSRVQRELSAQPSLEF